MEENEIVCLSNLWIILALAIVLILSGCRTEYYESGKVKSEGFSLGSQGLGNYSILSVHLDNEKGD